jgi:hypothetical protein
MRELEFAGHPSLYPTRSPRAGHASFPLSRTAFIVSIVVHVLAGYFLIQHRWAEVPEPTRPADFFLFELPAPAPVPGEEPLPESSVAPPQVEELVPEPPPRAAEAVAPPVVVVEPAAVDEPVPIGEPVPETEIEPAGPSAPAPVVDLDEARRRAARDVVTERAESAYMTFSLDDVAPPRPEKPDEPERSIFDGTGGPRGPSVGQLGQARTKFGHRVAALCNALTGGFSLMGWGSFCAGPADGGPSGLFPEVRPADLDLMPECVDTRDTAPALALEAPFSTVKCRLVMPDELEGQP